MSDLMFALETNTAVDRLSDLLEGMWRNRLFVTHHIDRRMIDTMGRVDHKASEHLERYTRDMLGRQIAEHLPYSRRLLRFPEDITVGIERPDLLGRHIEARAEVMVVTIEDFQRIQDALTEVLIDLRWEKRLAAPPNQKEAKE